MQAVLVVDVLQTNFLSKIESDLKHDDALITKSH